MSRLENNTCSYPGCSNAARASSTNWEGVEIFQCEALGHQLWVRAFIKSKLCVRGYRSKFPDDVLQAINGTFDMAGAIAAELEATQAAERIKERQNEGKRRERRWQLLLAIIAADPPCIHTHGPTDYAKNLSVAVEAIEKEFEGRL